MGTKQTGRRIVPALGVHGLTALYDPLVAWTTRERTFRARLLAQAGLRAGHDVLDLGCGTGSLALCAMRLEPAARIVGLDADPAVLARARTKAHRAGLELRFECGNAEQLPFADRSFDRVLSSLFLHHLRPEQKRRALTEVVRVLRPRGEFHVADWGPPRFLPLHVTFLIVRLLDGFAPTAENVRGGLPALFDEAGLADVAVRGALDTVLGTIEFHATRKF